MMASLFSGVSGLKNHQVKMNVIGNNIANINTIGYKSARVNFQEALVTTLRGAGRPSAIAGGTNPVQLGLGMQVATVDNMFKQGGMETTGQITDLAIQGDGFFILGDSSGNNFYTRAGAFGYDANANLVDPATGLFVQGKMADSNGEISGLATLGNITLPFGSQDPASATQSIWLSSNLSSNATDSLASLTDAGSSGVTSVNGKAVNGVGGAHVISITGNQAQQAQLVGALGGLVTSTTLGSLVPAVTSYNDFGITVDGGADQRISGLTATSTIGDLVQEINLLDGLSCELVGGNVVITRDKAGDPNIYNFEGTEGVQVTDDIFDVVFLGGGHAPTTNFTTSGGAASTYVATDVFTPSQGAGPVTTTLGLVTDSISGLVTGLSGLGGGDVTVSTGVSGLNATTAGNELKIDTADTLHSTSMNVFDSQGAQHPLLIEFFKSAVPNRWEWTASCLEDNFNISNGGSGYVTFDADGGALTAFAFNGSASAITITKDGGGTSPIEIAINAGTIGAHDGLTGQASNQSHTAQIVRQDGYGLGMLEKTSIDQSGYISGIFSNGVTRVLAQLSLGQFSNQGGLRKAGKSFYQESPNSGQAVIGEAGVNIAATIFSGALEASTVDVAEEFTSMITTQRGFQANARIITTSDSMLDELVNIKR